VSRSGTICENGANTEVNAAFTQTSIGPRRSSTSSAASLTCSSSATSTSSGNASHPAVRASFAVASNPALPRASKATPRARRAYSRTTARPTPPVAPVITTTCDRAAFRTPGPPAVSRVEPRSNPRAQRADRPLSTRGYPREPSPQHGAVRSGRRERAPVGRFRDRCLQPSPHRVARRRSGKDVLGGDHGPRCTWRT
jgi:hypothetical protein